MSEISEIVSFFNEKDKGSDVNNNNNSVSNNTESTGKTKRMPLGGLRQKSRSQILILDALNEDTRSQGSSGDNNNAINRTNSGFSFASAPRPVGSNKKVVLVRRKKDPEKGAVDATIPGEIFSSSSPPTRLKQRREVIVARKVSYTPPPSTTSATINPRAMMEEIPMSLAVNAKRGPRRDAEGNYIARTMLGDPEDFKELKTQLVGPDQEDFRFEEQRQEKLQAEQERYLKYVDRRKKREEKERQRHLQSMQVFEQTQILKQERALERWNETQQDWEQVKSRLMHRTGKGEDQLVLSRIEDFRNHLEEKELVERSIYEEKDGYLDPMWRPFRAVGSSVSGLYVRRKDPNTNPVEIIRNPSTLRAPLTGTRTLRREFDEYKRKRKLKFSDQPLPDEQDTFGMVVRGQQMHIHSGQPHVVEAVGSYAASLVVTTPTEMEQNSDINLPPPRPTIQVWTGDENQPFIDESLLNQSAGPEASEATSVAGPVLEIDDMELLFFVERGQLGRQSLRMRNAGTTAIYYHWIQAEEPNPLQIPKDGVRRFYLMNVSGVLQPRESKTVYFMFKSPDHGIFTESYILHTEPPLVLDPKHAGPKSRFTALSSSAADATSQAFSPIVLKLRGVSTRDDDLKDRREEIELRIASNEILRGVGRIVESIILRAEVEIEKLHQPVVVQARKQDDAAALAERRDLFSKSNPDLHLFFTHSLMDSLEGLAENTRELLHRQRQSQQQQQQQTTEGQQQPRDEEDSWNLSILDLSQMISSLQDEQQQADLLRELNQLVLLGSTPPAVVISSPPLLPRIVRDVFVELAEALPDLAKRERESLGLVYKPFTTPNNASAAGTFEDEDQHHGKEAHGGEEQHDAGDVNKEKGARRRRKKVTAATATTTANNAGSNNLKPVSSTLSVGEPSSSSSQTLRARKSEEVVGGGARLDDPAAEKRKALEIQYRDSLETKMRDFILESLIRLEEVTQFLPKKLPPPVIPIHAVSSEESVAGGEGPHRAVSREQLNGGAPEEGDGARNNDAGGSVVAQDKAAAEKDKSRGKRRRMAAQSKKLQTTISASAVPAAVPASSISPAKKVN